MSLSRENRAHIGSSSFLLLAAVHSTTISSWAFPALVGERQAAAEEAFLVQPSGVGSHAHVGTVSDVSGDTVVLGSVGEAVHIYTRDRHGTPNDPSDDTWSGPVAIANPLPGPGYFGYSVAIDGDALVVGVPLFDTTTQADLGSACVYHRSAGAWCLVAILTASDGSAADQFGFVVSVNGPRVLVGAPYDDTSLGLDSGSAYVFERNTQGTPNPCDDTYFEQAQLFDVQPGAGPHDRFGFSVAIEGDVALVGAVKGGPGNPQSPGSASFFRRTGTTWTGQSVVAPAGTPADQFGVSVGLSGSTAVIGASRADVAGLDAGAAYVFGRDANLLWVLSGTLVAPSPAQDEFGSALDIDNDVIAVGAYRTDLGAHQDGGVVHVFYRSSPGSFAYDSTLNACNGLAIDTFGVSTRLSGDTLLVGADLRDKPPAIDVGAGYVYRLTTPEPFESLCYGDGGPGATTCPCGNNSVQGRKQGCLNTTQVGGRIFGLGSADATADDLDVAAHNLPGTSPGLLFVGTGVLAGGSGVPFVDGLLCAAGVITRLGIQFTNAGGRCQWGPGLRTAGLWAPGDVRLFQVWYRDLPTGPCGSAANTTNVLRVTFR